MQVLHTGSPSSLIHTIHRRSTGSGITSDHMTGNNWHKLEGIVSHRTRSINKNTVRAAETTVNDLTNGADHMTTKMADDEAIFREVEDIDFDEDEILVYEVRETNLFYIDNEDYIVVANSSTFPDYEAIEFYVSILFIH